MSDLKRELEIAEERIAAWTLQANKLRNKMTEQQPVNGVKQWSPVGGHWWIRFTGDVVYNGDSTPYSREFGTERPTCEQAKLAMVEMRKFNRLLALRDELCGYDVADWSDASTCKYTIEFIVDENRWAVDPTCIYHKITIYFTTIKHAQRACDMLNSGEVVL